MASKKQQRNADIVNLSGSLNPDTLDMDGAKALYDANADWYEELKSKADKGKKLSKDEQNAYDIFQKYDNAIAAQNRTTTPTSTPTSNTDDNDWSKKTWQERISAGHGTDADMETAYTEWKNGNYNPGPITTKALQDMDTQKNTNPTTTGASNPIPKGDMEKGNDNKLVSSPYEAYLSEVDAQKAKAEEETKKKNQEVKDNYGVDAETGNIKYASTINNLIDAGDSFNNFMDALSAKRNDKDIAIAKDVKSNSEKTLKQASRIDDIQNRLLSRANKDKESLQKEQDEAIAKRTALQEQLDSLVPDSMSEQDKEQVDATNAERANVDTEMQPIADEVNAISSNTELSPEEQIKQLDEVIANNSKKLQDMGETIIGLENKNLSIYKQYATQTNNKDALKAIQTIENYQAKFQSIFSTDENGNLIANLTEEGKKQLLANIQNSVDIINNDDSAINLKNAAKDMFSDTSKFVRFAIQDMMSAFLLVGGAASGSADMIRLGLDIGINRINNSFADSEANAKDKLLNAGIQNTTKAWNADTDAAYDFILSKKDVAEALANAGIDAKKQELLMQASIDSFDKYNTTMEDIDDPEKRAALAAHIATAQGMNSSNEVISGISTLLNQIALNMPWLFKNSKEGFAEGGIVGNADGATMGQDNTVINAREGEMVLNADQQKRLFDILNGDKAVNTKGKTNNIMDGILKRGSTKKETTEPKEEKQDISDSTEMKMSKQQVLANALGQRSPQALNNAINSSNNRANTQAKGWGKNN